MDDFSLRILKVVAAWHLTTLQDVNSRGETRKPNVTVKDVRAAMQDDPSTPRHETIKASLGSLVGKGLLYAYKPTYWPFEEIPIPDTTYTLTVQGWRKVLA